VEQITTGTPAVGSALALWGRGFRPFFLAAALYAALFVPLSTAVWLGAWPAPAWGIPAWWHGHEMLFGVVAAAIAGFLTTAAPVWAGRSAPSGAPLAALLALWAAGRVAMLASGRLPAVLVAALDVAFLPALAIVLAHTLRGRAQRRNHGIVAVVVALAVANAATHAEALGLADFGTARRALHFAVAGVIVLVVVIGGRITPAFTTNALGRRVEEADVTDGTWRRRAALAGVLASALLVLLAPDTAAERAVSIAAGIAVAARMTGWQTRRALADPLLWSLHAGMAWVAIGLVLRGLVPAGSAGLHALTAGAMGAMILAVMTRVGLGHTGRPLALPPGGSTLYGLVHAAALARVLASLLPGAGPALLVVSATAWSLAFAGFLVLYTPILLRPRVDGRPG
jgi:uncharacterized protein involved in response to NO